MISQIGFGLGFVLSFLPWMNAPMALVLGAILSLTLGNPYAAQTRSWTHRLLSLSIIGLGAGMNLITVGKVGAHGILYTAISIIGTLSLGLWLGKRFGLSRGISTLISTGTAICGGSAIAAVAPVIQAEAEETSISLAVVFILNAVALVIFPIIGHWAHLDETQFGLWSALAIHDTSSVVGAAMQFGKHALEVGTTVKLARALWIIPVTFFFAMRTKSDAKPKRPWFILGFLLMAALVTWIPDLAPFGSRVEAFARRLLVVTLFLIGTGMSRENLKRIGAKPLFQAILLWLIVGSTTFVAIGRHWIR